MNLIQPDNSGTENGESVFSWVHNGFELTPLRITLIYIMFGLFALYFSDVLLVLLVDEPILDELQMLKGVLEILVTGGLLFWLTSTHQGQIDHSTARLERQQEELLVLHRVLRHNLRNDLNVIIGRSEQLQESGTGEFDRRYGAVIHQTATNIFHYTEQAELIRKVSSQPEGLHDIDLSDAIPSAARSHPLVTESVDVEIDVPENAIARVNRMFPHAIIELIENAVKHNDSETPRVEISVAPDAGSGNHLEVRIEDNGPGISERVIAILEQSEYDQLTHLQGLGLWFVYWVVKESNGHMIFDETEEGGASVRLQLPKAGLLNG